MLQAGWSGARDRALEFYVAEFRTADEVGEVEDWDEVFEEFLLSESDITLSRVLQHLSGAKESDVNIYDDILEVIQEYQSDRLVAIFCEAIPELDTLDLPDEFETLFPILSYLLAGGMECSVTPYWAARLVYSVLEKSSNVSRYQLTRLHRCVYRKMWPSDLSVTLVMLRIERRFNELLFEQRTTFADLAQETLRSLAEETTGDLSNLIYIEQLLIRQDWPLDDMRFNLPYAVREQIGDLSGIEDDLIAILDEQTREENGIIVLKSPSSCSGRDFISGIE